MLANLACPISRLRGGMRLHYGTEITPQTDSESWHRRLKRSFWKLQMNDCATFSKSLNPRNIDKSVSDIRIRFPFVSGFRISVSGCKLTVLPDIQPANRIVIISGSYRPGFVNSSGILHQVGNPRPIWSPRLPLAKIHVSKRHLRFRPITFKNVFPANHIRERFSGSTGSSAYRFCRNQESFSHVLHWCSLLSI